MSCASITGRRQRAALLSSWSLPKPMGVTMKSLNTVRYSLIAAAVAGAAVVSAPAVAGVSASAGVASLYLWRGYNLSNGAPQVFGGLEYATEVGAYAGVWGSNSADIGQEVDLYAGFRGTAGDFSYNIAYYDYTYPQAKGVTSVPAVLAGDGARISDFEEITISGSIKGFTLEAWLGIGDTGGLITNAAGEATNESNYYAVSYAYDKFTVKYGMTDNDPLNTDYSHADVSYKYNDNLTFAVSKVVDDDDSVEDDALFVVSYTLPLDLKK